jgi:predicted SnoaL-like aldol condensation-catalyzing enzyme
MKAHLAVFALLTLFGNAVAAPNYSRDPKQIATSFVTELNAGGRWVLMTVSQDRFIPHNAAVQTGYEGLREWMSRNRQSPAPIEVKRVFQDGDYVFTQSQSNTQVGFDVFRFSNGQIVEHWDNYQDSNSGNPSGHTMIDGSALLSETGMTGRNKSLVMQYVQAVYVNGWFDRLSTYRDPSNYTEHDPQIGDSNREYEDTVRGWARKGLAREYTSVHKVLAEGNFVLVMSEGTLAANPVAYYDMFRVQNDRIVEHWNTIEPIPTREFWKNSNGKF